MSDGHVTPNERKPSGFKFTGIVDSEGRKYARFLSPFSALGCVRMEESSLRLRINHLESCGISTFEEQAALLCLAGESDAERTSKIKAHHTINGIMDQLEAIEEAVDPLVALLFAVIHGHIGQNADGDEMVRLSSSDYKRIQAAVEGSQE